MPKPVLDPVPEPRFAQSERPSHLVPILLALAAIALAAALTLHLFPATTPRVEHLRTELLPTHTVYQSNSIVLGPTQAENVLFLASTLRIDNRLRLPISLDDFTLTLTDPTGAQLTSKAFEKQDLPNLQLSFPALKSLLATPLLRETSIAPGQSAQGTLLFSLKLPQSIWDTRKSAVITVSLYHQPPIDITIPKP